MHELLQPDTGKPLLLLGNEAIVRGALEGNVRFVAAYPGTPSSEILDRFYQLAGEADVYVEYSVNEKVSLEMSCAAAVSGVRSLCSMKHVGLNVAADAFMTLAYVGVQAGMVIVSADDPSLHSSQNEQDNRYYAKMAGIPMLEPSTPEEAKAMTLMGLDLSEKYRIPVMLRTTTRVNHCRGPVRLGTLPEQRPSASFRKDPFNLVVVPMVGRRLRLLLLEKLAGLQQAAEQSPLNFTAGDGRWGIVTSGVSYLYVRDAIQDLKLEDRVKVLKIGFSHPHPKTLFQDFLQSVDKVLVVEELEPYLEEAIKVAAQEAGVTVPIAGKGADFIPRAFELDAVKVKKAVSRHFGVPYDPPKVFSIPELPQRPPNLCPGCPHRATFYAIKKTFGQDAVYPTDIGCYTLGLLPPLNMADFLICMGSSVSTAGGFSKVLTQPVIAYIGDSTFFHAGVPGLINAVANNHHFLLVVLDNGTTAMTGHQPNPGMELTKEGKIAPRVSIEAVVKGCGVERVFTANPLQVKKTQETIGQIKAAMAEPGVSVLISKSPCPLHERRMTGKKQKVVFAVADSCDLCRQCLDELGCPAFVWEEGGETSACIRIDPALCSGCSVCSQICSSIKPKRLEKASQAE
jgi:indolepyruvate ferredoxin oxidoreductase alpha subunit